jgi:DNA-binding transcriptional LysR family regulator
MSRQQDLDVFVQVIKSGSFAKAAEQLQLNPSAVSRRISHLEQRLGVQLLNRTTRRLSLTEVGERYFNRCLSILADIEEAEREARQYSQQPQGTLYVSCSTYFAYRFLLTKIPPFLEQYPQISLKLILTDDVVDLVTDGIDVAIRIGELADASLMTKKLISSRRIICAAPKYLDRYGIPKTPDELADHNCLSLNAQKTTLNQWRFRDASGQREIRVRGNFEVNSGQALYEAILAGGGIGRVIQVLSQRELTSGQLVHLLKEYEEDNDVGIYAVFPAQRYLLPKVQCFVEFLAKSFSQDVTSLSILKA